MSPPARSFRLVLPRGLGRGAGAAMALALGACAAPPVAQPVPAVALPAQWLDEVAAGAVPAAALQAAWWRAFKDPVLDALVARALAGNHDVAAAAARLRAARALLPAADAAQRPQLALAAGPQASADGRNGYFQAGFDASWELDLFGRAGLARSLAEADAGIAESEAQAARVSLVAEVVRSYLEWRQALGEAALLSAQVDVAAERERLLKIQLDNRLAPADELDVAAAALASAKAALAEPRMQAARSRERLGVLLGDTQAAVPEPAADDGEPPRVGLAATPADLVRLRPEIRRAEQQVLKAAAAVGIARAELMPQFSLVGTLAAVAGVSGVDAGTTRGLLSAGPALRLPLLDAGRRRAAIDAREAELDAAVAQYRQAVADGLGEAQAALAQWHLMGRRADAAAQAEAALARREAAVDTRRQLRLADALQLAEARAARLQAAQAVQQARLGERLAFVAFCKAMGGAPMPAAEGSR